MRSVRYAQVEHMVNHDGETCLFVGAMDQRPSSVIAEGRGLLRLVAPGYPDVGLLLPDEAYAAMTLRLRVLCVEVGDGGLRETWLPVADLSAELERSGSQDEAATGPSMG